MTTQNEYIGYDLIVECIPERSRVLDLGCGDGELLLLLQKKRLVTGFGVEISDTGVSNCVEKGLYCYQGDIDEGLADYKDNAFDYVILNQTIQDTKRPSYIIQEILRISSHAIVSFPNFGYLLTRFQLLFKGRMPKNFLFPHEWYESQDFHHLTIEDFKDYCDINRYIIRREMHFNVKKDGTSKPIKILPNLRAQYGFLVLSRY